MVGRNVGRGEGADERGGGTMGTRGEGAGRSRWRNQASASGVGAVERERVWCQVEDKSITIANLKNK